jgi:KDO2-lipid IV(A) lauroyltransferase
MHSLAMIISRSFLLFPNNIQSLIAKLVGLAIWLAVSKRRKNMMIKNIRKILHVTESEAYKIGKESITRFGGMLADLLQYPRLSKKNIKKMVDFQGLENLENALAYSKGVVMVTGHCGNWELLGAALAYQGFPMVAVTKRQKNHNFDRFINVFRHIPPGGTVLYKDNLRDVIRALGKNKIPLIFIDVDGHDTGVFVEFFNQWTSTPPGAAVLAKMCGSPIVPAFISQVPNGKHHITLEAPVWVDNSIDKKTAIYDTIQCLSSILEKHICRSPNEWFWLQDRWRTKKVE